MKTLNIIIINFLLLLQNSFAQDTIIFKNKNILAVKLLEISQNEIKYTQSKSIDEPIYIVSKNDVAFIKYPNGIIDTIKSTVNHKDSLVVTNLIGKGAQKISIIGKKLLYDNRSLGDRKLKFLIQNYPYAQTKETLMKEYKKMKHYEMTQKVYAPIGFVIGFAIPVASSYYALENDANDIAGVFLGGIITGAAVRIVSNVIHHVSGNKRHHTKREIALLYNQNL